MLRSSHRISSCIRNNASFLQRCNNSNRGMIGSVGWNVTSLSSPSSPLPVGELSLIPSTSSSSSRWMSTAASLKKKVDSDLVGGLSIRKLKELNPYLNVVRYEHKNRTWTTHHVDFYSEALAIGFVDAGLLPGDVVLSFMPEHWSETMVLQFACSKAGMVLYTLESSLPQKDPEAAKLALRKALELTKANVLISPEAHDDFNYVRLVEDLIPELMDFDTHHGLAFLAPQFPHLRFCIQTGYDEVNKRGWTRLRHFIVPSGSLQNDWLRDHPLPTPDTPLMGQLVTDERGVPVKLGNTLSNQQVITQGVWETYSKILHKNFHQVQGTGVVF